MAALHLIYQHWFITILLSWFAIVPVVGVIANAFKRKDKP